jgi:hypothetical protein
VSISEKLRRKHERKQKDPVKYRALANKNQKAWRKKYPEKHKAKERNRHYRRSYGITYAEALALLARQGWACAVCPAPLKTLGGNAHVDHCHKTKKVRGILCRICNMQIGWFERWPDFYRFATVYLRRENVV